jgi:UrcA family protein
MTFTKSLTIIAVAAAALATSAAAAQSAEPRSVSVSYADLNLGTPTGQSKLANRVRHAAVKACENGSNQRDLAAQAQFQTCVKVATSRALASINTQAAGVGNGNQ